MNARLASFRNRAHLVVGEDNRLVDIEQASNGSLSSDPMLCLAKWDQVRALSKSVIATTDAPNAILENLDCPVPRPRQLFAVGLNYRKHAEEMGSPLPDSPLTFAKFQSALNTPAGDIPLVGDTCDYESEVVVVISIGGRNIGEPEAWNHIAGLCAGQDISDRQLQNSGRPPQFSLGKSRQGFAPIGPWVCDVRDHPKRDDLMIGCTVNGDVRQQTSTNDMIFDIPQLVSYLSTICELFPGDIIFTGTPSGVGHGHKPPVYLRPGDEIVTSLEMVGTLRNRCV
jgi:2-keto-4-pentenoate hydratase/2-oxohepta-3-ene-1,7-dioic acid hydratase in catechol pathway